MLAKVLVPFGLSTISLYKFMTAKVNDRFAEVYEPPSTSIILCSLNEEAFIADALESLENQNVRRCFPDKFETLLVDSHSEDRTVEIAEQYGWKVHQAKRGKLNARHLGVEKAKGEVVVSVDADSRYGINWLNLMLRWFSTPDVVGVVGPRLVKPEEGIGNTAFSVWFSLFDVGPLLLGGMRMPGQSAAFYRDAYFEVGGWDLSIDQQNVHEMITEEEIRFAMKLRRLGRVVVDWQAPAFTSARRASWIGRNREGYKHWRQERLRGERF